MIRFLIPMLLAGTMAMADQAKVTEARATQSGDTWRFDVTISHPDTGWDHYADGWAVLDAEGNELGFRKLHHPHVEEQPFTRSLGGVTIPDGITTVFIRAHDSVHGWSDETFEIKLP